MLHRQADLNRIQSDGGTDIRLELLGYVNFPVGHRGIVHSHPFWEVVYLGGGHGTFRRQSENRPCGRDEIVLVSPGERHQFLAGPADSLEQLYVGFSFHLNASRTPAWNGSRVLPTGPALDLIRAELKECHDRLKAQGKASESIRTRLMPVIGRLVGLIVDAATGGDESGADRERTPVQMAQEFLQSNLRSPLTVAQLARRFCLSAKYFGETFKRETGLTLKEYQTRLRMHRARELLRKTDKPISAIAEDVGMENPAYFARQFKKQFRVSARQWRQDGKLPKTFPKP